MEIADNAKERVEKFSSHNVVGSFTFKSCSKMKEIKEKKKKMEGLQRKLQRLGSFYH